MKTLSRLIRSPLTPDGLQAEGWYASLNGKDRFIFFDAAPVRDRAGEFIAAIQTLQELAILGQLSGSMGHELRNPLLPKDPFHQGGTSL